MRLQRVGLSTAQRCFLSHQNAKRCIRAMSISRTFCCHKGCIYQALTQEIGYRPASTTFLNKDGRRIGVIADLFGSKQGQYTGEYPHASFRHEDTFFFTKCFKISSPPKHIFASIPITWPLEPKTPTFWRTKTHAKLSLSHSHFDHAEKMNASAGCPLSPKM